MVSRPPTRYARSGDAQIAYQVLGDGPLDLVLVGGPASHLDLQWDDPETARTYERLASFSRLIRFDRRGTGLSDPLNGRPMLDQQMDDLHAVLEAVGAERVALYGAVEAGLCALFAATHGDRVCGLVLANTSVAGGLVLSDDRRESLLDLIENHWGEGAFISLFAPSRALDERFLEWWARLERACMSPSMARQVVELNARVDLSGVMPAIRVPTLVLQLRDSPLVPVSAGREATSLIPGARLVEADGTDCYMWPTADDPEMDLIEEFLTGRRPDREPERMLATVMFTDIVGSTGRAASLGDRAWRGVLEDHNAFVRDRLAQFRGREVKNLGDGFIATFDGPTRAVACAQEIVGGVGALGISIRCGLHTGECELLGDDISGIAVHIGEQVCELAGEREVLVSSTVKDLVVGSTLEFDDRGTRQLRGVPGEWRLYAVRSASDQ
jgi:class 3 adenylate cyclase